MQAAPPPAISSPAVAANPSPALPIGMIQSPCPPPVPPSAVTVAVIGAVLKPGPLDPVLMARYLAPALVAERNKADAEQRQRDWPNLCRYKAANAALAKGPPLRAVFIGDSLTEAWQTGDAKLFRDGVVGRGISGQTSPQILLRFYPDVIALKPKVVHILCGVNDIAGNTGPNSARDYENNIMAMVTLAKANGIKVVLGSLTPTNNLYWSAAKDPAAIILELNAWLKRYAAQAGVSFVDYYTPLVGNDGAFPSKYSNEGVHANMAGYDVMRPLAEAALRKAER